MVVIPEKTKKKLKKPLGRLYRSPDFLGKIRRKRIIAVGDESVLVLLERSVRPHLAVFDFKIKRRKISKNKQNLLVFSFKKRRKYRNRRGTVSDYLLRDARKLIKEGGALLIDGEEDLTALAFIVAGGKKDIVIYGQPDKGMVVVEPEKAKKKVMKMLSAAGAFGHEVK